MHNNRIARTLIQADLLISLFLEIHPQTQHESNNRNYENQREGTATWAILFIISFLKTITLKYYTRTVAESAARKMNGGQLRQI